MALRNLKKASNAAEYETLRLSVVSLLQLLMRADLDFAMLQSVNYALAQANEKAAILDNREALLQYISTFGSSIFTPINITPLQVQLKPEYAYYLRVYGKPPNGVFNSDLLAQIELMLKNVP